MLAESTRKVAARKVAVRTVSAMTACAGLLFVPAVAATAEQMDVMVVEGLMMDQVLVSPDATYDSIDEYPAARFDIAPGLTIPASDIKDGWVPLPLVDGGAIYVEASYVDQEMTVCDINPARIPKHRPLGTGLGAGAKDC